ncbi:MAG: cation transporter [Crocinitomicaceae bacterium]|nr:cation transporter [Crocinitomicaceae bacterium]
MKYQFKTNIKCGGCIEKVTPALEKLNDITWEVDTNIPEKILTVETENISENEVIQAVEQAGFKIEKI